MPPQMVYTGLDIQILENEDIPFKLFSLHVFSFLDSYALFFR